MSELTISQLIRKRGVVKRKLTNFVAFFECVLASANEDKVIELKDRVEKLQLLENEFEEIQIQLETFCDDNDYEIHLNERDIFSNLYFAKTAEAKAFLKRCSDESQFTRAQTPTFSDNNDNESVVTINTSSSAANNNNNKNSTKLSQVKLPTISLPKYNGDYHHWLEFKDSYESMIHKNESIDSVQKFHYLRASLEGDAAKVIQALEFSAVNYYTAWDLICSRYNNSRLLIHSHLRALFDIENMQRENAVGLRNTINMVSEHLHALEILKQPVQYWDTLIIFIVTLKLDKSTSREWEKHKGKNDYPTLKEFLDYLKNRADWLETVDTNYSVKLNKGQKDSRRVSLISSAERKPKCNFCKKDHKIYSCESFLQLSIPERLSKVKQLKLCPNCLWIGHEVQGCRSRPCSKCNSKHNSLLHQENSTDHSTSSQSSSENQVALFAPTYERGVLLSTAVVAVYDAYGTQHTIRILLDSGSQSNFISRDLCAKLNLKECPVNISIVGINKVQSALNARCEVAIHSLNSTFSTTLSCYVLPKIADLLPDQTIDISAWNIPPNAALADPHFNVPGEIDVLIGAGLFWNVIFDQVIKLEKGLPILRNTSFGWIVSGGYREPARKVSCNLANTVNLENELKNFWEIEEVPREIELSADESECESYFRETTKRNKEGRFVVRIPFKLSPSLLGCSKDTAVKRLINLERRFRTNPELQTLYVQFMNDYCELGHMSSSNEIPESEISYFLPHHGVMRKDSLTTKLRVVFDGSSPSNSGWSLNDLQYIGPPILNDFFGMLLRFRQSSYVVTADITKMYRQILINPMDRNLQKIVWRNSSGDPIQTFTLNTVTYGTTSAPYLAIRCLKQLAFDSKHEFPAASAIIEKDFYVDDLISGFDSELEAIQICKQISCILNTAHFPLRKWNSNSRYILDNLQDHLDPMSVIPLGSDKTFKTLGICWNSKDDFLMYQLDVSSQHNKVTKRTILSEIARIFDPLGLVSPCVILSKIILQNLWCLKLDWDDPIPKELDVKWSHFRKTLPVLNVIKIKRHSICRSPSKIELHAFCDASQDAYAACIYLRSIDNQGTITTNLLCAKTKVAPLKSLTIPRLELCGALLLTRLFKRVTDTLTISFDSFLWTDSEIVLAWLKTEPRSLKTFVSNRVAEIQTVTSISNWNHVDSKENPADLASRGVMPNTLLTSKLWWSGPSWLQMPQSNWPNHLSNSISLSSVPELKKSVKVLTSTIQDPFPFNKYSNFERLKRIISYCLRFISNSRKDKTNLETGPLTVIELKNSQNVLIKLAQNESFPQEIESLKTKTLLKKKSNIVALHPFFDSDGLLRVGGRLINSEISYDAKHPILLSGKHQLTKLIAEHLHRLLLHASPQLLLSTIRQQFWPTSGMQLVKRVVRNCVKCVRFKPKPIYPIMANLPKERVTVANPFDNTGIDFAGPFILKDRKGRGSKPFKAYVCLFICLVSKAIHLELVTDLTADAFLACLRRFVSRRGKPSKIFSDNGTNFVGAERQLKSLFKMLTNSGSEIMNNCTKDNISWHFIPPNSPHFGGLWEAGIKSVKIHLLKVIGTTKLTYEEFSTVLTQVEAVLNSRPLSPLSNDPHDLQPLTPSHFLIGRPLTELPDPNLQEVRMNKLSRYQVLQQIRQNFWSRWSRDYLTSLQRRNKWKQSSPEIQIGKMVLIKHDNLPPSRWLLGRVISLHPGQDGVTRVVTVKTVKGLWKRAVTKLCALPEND